MIGVELLRDGALQAAACVVATPADEVPTARGWPARPADWRELRDRFAAHEASDDPVRLRLCDELGLDPVAYGLVLLCAAVEVEPTAAAAVSLLTEDPRVLLPTPTVVALVLSGMTERPFDAVLAASIGGGAAGRLGLVEVVEPGAGLPHSHHGLRLVARELVALLDQPATVGAAQERAVTTLPPGPAVAFAAELVQRAASLLDRHPVLVVRGSRRSGRQLACDLGTVTGLPVHLVTVDGEPPRASELARLRDGLLAVDLHGADPAPAAALASFHRGGRPVLVLVGPSADASGPAVDVPPFGYPEALRVWQGLVPSADAATLAARYRVGVDEAGTACREAAELEPTGATGDAIARRVRARGARRVGRQVSVVDTSARLDDLVVPAALRAQLDEIVGWHRGSWRVRWGMELDGDGSTGPGLTCLFSGKPGTGKTFAARCLAGELGLNLYRIDLSRVVSKYIGDTEKALAGVFDEVEAGHGVLLFDEADAIFGRRSEVKDAHDRYANIEVSYLLQRLETYDGVAVLTTNLQGNMDAAFVRRLRFILQFPEPDRELRRRLWERSLPDRRWREDDLDLAVLADRFALNGGAIRNIGLGAAHLAADTPSGRVSAAHVLRATQRELRKTGRPADAAAFGPLGRLVDANGDGPAPRGDRR